MTSDKNRKIEELKEEIVKLKKGILTPNQNRMLLLLEKQKQEINSYKKFDKLYANCLDKLFDLERNIKNCIRYNENATGHTEDGIFFEVKEVLDILEKVMKDVRC